MDRAVDERDHAAETRCQAAWLEVISQELQQLLRAQGRELVETDCAAALGELVAAQPSQLAGECTDRGTQSRARSSSLATNARSCTRISIADSKNRSAERRSDLARYRAISALRSASSIVVASFGTSAIPMPTPT